MVLEYGVSASAVAVSWTGYFVSLLDHIGIHLPAALTSAPLGYQDGHLVHTGALFNLPAVAIVLALTWLCYIGIRESSSVNTLMVFLKVGLIVIVIVAGWNYVDPQLWHPFIPENKAPGVYGWDGIFRAASIIFFAYVGFEAVSTAAQEAKDPQKDMPFGILGALIICTILYMGVSAVMTGIVPYQQLNVAEPMAVAVDKIGLGWFAFLIKVGAILGLSSVMMVLIYGQTRIFYVISRDGLLPQFFCKVHPKFHTPHINTMVVGLIVAVAAGVTPIALLGDLVSLGTLLAFMIVCFSVLYLRYKQPELPRPFRTPGAPITPLLGMATCGYLVFSIFFGADASGQYVLPPSS